MPQSFACLHYHVVFGTKDRSAQITKTVQQRLYDYMGGIVRSSDGVLVSAGGTSDHVHLLLSLPRGMSVADAVRRIKANSSKWIRQTFSTHGTFGWQTGYGAFTVSFSKVSQVRRYIENQEQHHRTRTFDEEVMDLLTRHSLPFDERYVRG